MRRMRNGFMIVVQIAVLIILTSSAHAALELRGTDTNGYQLIYDTDLNITWYDYSNARDNQPDQMLWVSNLSVNFEGNIYDDWRLPILSDQLCEGLNCTNSEMGHLYYTELGNIAWPDSGYGLSNRGPFVNLLEERYWFGTYFEPDSYGTDIAYNFRMSQGSQIIDDSFASKYAIAVRSGDVAVAPEPISSLLFVTGGTLLAGKRYLKRKMKK